MPVIQFTLPHKTSHENGGTDEIDATGLTGAGGGGLANLEDFTTIGVKFAAGADSIYDNAELGSIWMSNGAISIASSGATVELAPDNNEVVDIVSGDGLLLPALAADPTAVRDGHTFYNTATDRVRLRANGAWVELVMQTPNGLVFPSLAADPGSPVAGQVYFNTSTNKLKAWDGSAWNNLW